MPTKFPTIDQLKRAIEIEEQIEELKSSLFSLLSGSEMKTASSASPSADFKKDGRSGRRSSAIRAKMAASQQARRAKKSGSAKATDAGATERVAGKKRRVMSSEARNRISAAQKKRWAAVRAV